MDRNAESHFSKLPNVDISRSKIVRINDRKTTFNTGELIPIYVDEALPGDTFSMRMASVVRMSTPIHPVMDNAYLDIYFFAVPNRLVWSHWKEFMGENTTTYWEVPTQYEIPQLTSPSGGWNAGTIADYLGLPIGKANLSVSALYTRSYALIVNEWFRDQNVQSPASITLGDTTTAGNNGSTYTTDLQKGGMPFKVAKYHDYFTSALPEPQKGPDVLLPLGDTAAVIGTGKTLGLTDGTLTDLGLANRYDSNAGARLAAAKTAAGTNAGSTVSQVISDNLKTLGVTTDPTKSGIIADLSTAQAATINEFRQALAVQRLYEKDARGGTRYTEIVKSHFGVTSPDARLQRPEYIGGKRIPINMTQVLQTSSTDSTSPQGNTAAFSQTNDDTVAWTKSFTEHSIILGLAVVRTQHTYQQGINRMFSRKKRTDYYWPELANIGEQAILNKEIYAQGSSVINASTGKAYDEEAFGYQEPWAEYRFKPSEITGQLRSTYSAPLDSWHYGDNYASLPVLGPDWIKETTANMDRTLAVQSSTAHQFIADFTFENTSVRPMPVYSIPGITGHH